MSRSPEFQNPHVDHIPTPEPCEGCGRMSEALQEVPGYAWKGGPACWVWICEACAEGGDPRERGEDDGVEYGHPGDYLQGDE